jgi:hypothetical protein
VLTGATTMVEKMIADSNDHGPDQISVELPAPSPSFMMT